jgi:gamma-glutamylcyclotransferase (GGCT)/AIG2-like uncharacterized protein YtfP
VTGAGDFDRDDLEAALDLIEGARSREAGDPERARGLLSAVERLLDDEADAADRGRAGGRALAELDEVLTSAGGDTEGVREFLEPILERLLDALLDAPERRLAVYGSLRPGEENHHHVADLVGEWRAGEVRGLLHEAGWGAARGYPGILRDPAGRRVPVQLLESRALPARWERLDDFEGPGYRRILIVVDTDRGPVVANIYALAEDPPPDTGARQRT